MEAIARYSALIKCELTNKKLNDDFSFDPETQLIWLYNKEKNIGPTPFKSYKGAKFFYLYGDNKPTPVSDAFLIQIRKKH